MDWPRNHEQDPAGFETACHGYVINCWPMGLPAIYGSLKKNARLAEDFELERPNLCCLEVRRMGEPAPLLLVTMSYNPAGSGFDPGALLATETGVLFLGAGERILAYRLDPPERLWEETADTGFLGWSQYSDTVLLRAELEFAAWSIEGKKLWDLYVEPPWDFTVENDMVHLNVMGSETSFPLRFGPPKVHG